MTAKEYTRAYRIKNTPLATTSSLSREVAVHDLMHDIVAWNPASTTVVSTQLGLERASRPALYFSKEIEVDG